MKSILFLFLMTPLAAWSHGEDVPGPHGGEIRMPGAFHTELVIDKDQSAHVYLLDIEFKNPTVKDSKVEVSAKKGKTEVKFTCSVMDNNHFHCIPLKKYDNTGEIIVTAVREKAQGNAATYKLPVKAFPKAKATTSHNGHEGH